MHCCIVHADQDTQLYTSEAPFTGCSEGNVIARVLSGKRPSRPRFQGGELMSDKVWSVLERSWTQSSQERMGAEGIAEVLGSSNTQDVVDGMEL